MKKDVKLISIEVIAEVPLIVAMIGTLVWTGLSLIFIGIFLTCYFLARNSMKD